MAQPRIDHIGVAVASLEDALTFYKGLGFLAEGVPPSGGAGSDSGNFEEIPGQGARVAMLSDGRNAIELIEPTGPETPVGRFLARRGPGLHHLCFEVEDIEAALGAARAAGLRLIDEEPRQGACGARIAFLHPQSAGGVLIELSEPAPASREKGPGGAERSIYA